MTRIHNTQSDELEHACKLNEQYSARIAQLEFKLKTAEAELARVNAEMGAQRRLRRQAKDLYHAVDAHILQSIDRRGYMRKPSKTAHRIPVLNLGEGDDMAALMKGLHEYDVRVMFRLKSPKTAMRLQYRLASKVYRTTRDITLRAAVRAYRMSGRGNHG